MKITRQRGLRAFDLLAPTVEQRGAHARGAEIESQYHRFIGIGAQKRREQGWIDLQAVFESYFLDHATHQPSRWDQMHARYGPDRNAHVIPANAGRLSRRQS